MTDEPPSGEVPGSRSSGDSVSKLLRLLLALLSAAVLVVGYFLFRWRENAGHSPNYGDLPTWLTFAVAVGGTIAALIQLRLQRRQLADQQKTITEEFARQKKRDELLDEQLAQVRAANRVLERQQAEKVDLQFDSVPITTPDGGVFKVVGNRHAARVANNSPRPIRDVRCYLERDASAPSELAAKISAYHPRMGVLKLEDRDSVDLMRPGSEYAFVFETTREDAPKAVTHLTFTDDAGLKWRIDRELHLERLPDEAA